jgi:signal transduction histidine kinase
LLDRSIREVRTLSYVLHPPMLDETGLEDAIRYYLKGYVDRTGIAVDFEVPPDFGRIRQDMELALFRVVQESLINAHRHSGTFTAKVRLARDPGVVWLEVIDYGRGIAGFAEKKFGRDYPGGGVGLLSMQERIKQVGGHLEIASSSEGTTVRVEIIADE